MTEQQRQFVEPLTVEQAGLYYVKMMREKGMQSAQKFWQAFREVHPEEVANRKDVVERGISAWDAAKYNNVAQPDLEGGFLDTATQSHFEWQVSDKKVKFIFDLLSDGNEHSRQEILEAMKSNGWESDVDFRKYVSDLRKQLVLCKSPYYVPKNKPGTGYGVYQLIKKKEL